MLSGIYAIKSATSGRVYVGSAASIPTRWSAHKAELRQGRHGNQHLQRAWNRDGADAFAFEVLEYCSKETLREREVFWMERLEAVKSGYNICPTPNGREGLPHSEATREKLRQRYAQQQADPVERAKFKAGVIGWSRDEAYREARRAQARAQWASGNIGRKRRGPA